MDTVKIGWGIREISVNEPVSLTGQMYLRISKGIHDPTYATALCIDGGRGQDAVIFCACDREGFYKNVVRQVQDRAKAMRPELPGENIIMNCTHTHAGAEIGDTPETSPDGQPIYPGAKYREFLIQACAEAICEAWDNRAPGALTYGYGYAVVGHSRRVIYTEDMSLANPNDVAPNGYGVMYGKTDHPSFSHYEAGADHFINLLYTFDENRKVTGVVVNVPCPSQISEHFHEMSSDFWHEVRQLVKKEFGEDVLVLPQCAAAGDLAPRTLHYKVAQARRMALKFGLVYDGEKASFNDYNKVMSERYDIAERIMDAIREVYSWACKDIYTQVPVRHQCDTVALKRRMVTDEEKQWCEDNIRQMKQRMEDARNGTPEEIRKAVSHFESVRGRNMQALQRYELQNEAPNMEFPIHVVQIGDIAFSSSPFETYMDYMHRIQARSPFMQTFVIQMAGCDNPGYLPTERAVANKGYSASLFCNRVGPEGGQQLVEATLSMLRRVKSREDK